MMKYISLISGAVLISLITITMLGWPIGRIASAESSGAQIDIWWPTDGSHVSGTLPFKALLSGSAVESYEMFWQVDGGSLNLMQNNYTDAPHKEASVDVSSWNWHGSGPYTVNFVAKQNGVVTGQHSVQIYIGDSAPTTATVMLAATSTSTSSPAVVTDSAATAFSTSTTTASTTTTSSVSVAPATTTSIAPVVTASTITVSAGTVSVWWPTAGVQISGVQPFKAVLSSASIENYNMFWQVDGGSLNLMQNNYTDAPHKEASVDVSGWHWQSTGLYRLTFTAQDFSGKILGTQSETVIVNPPATNGVTPASTPISTSTVVTTTTGVFGMKLYVNPNSSAASQALAWRASRPSDAAMMDILAAQPTAVWFGNWNSNIYTDVHSLVSAAQAKNAAPVIVLYDIPGRDCGSYSAGGTTASQYASWIASVSSAIGTASAIVILEPDALAQITCLSSQDQQTRLSLLQSAVKKLKSGVNTHVYIDAGHSGWIDAGTMASRLKSAGIAQADGFSLNVSNFNTTSDETSYGLQISAKLGGKHFVIDTGRNGLGSNGEWCNPAGRAIGTKPTSNTGNNLVDAYLWIKTPGESDGTCNGGPSAGSWWPDYALQLVKNAQ